MVKKEDLELLPASIKHQVEKCLQFEEDCKKQDELEFREFARSHNNLAASDFVLQYYNTTKKVLSDERLFWYLQVYGTNTYGASVAKFVLDNTNLNDIHIPVNESKPKECLKEFKDSVKTPYEITCTCDQPSITIHNETCKCCEMFPELIENSNTFQQFSHKEKTEDSNELFQLSKAVYQACKMYENKSITSLILFDMLYEKDVSKSLEDSANYKFIVELIKTMSSYGIIKRKNLTFKIVDNLFTFDRVKNCIVKACCYSELFTKEEKINYLQQLETLNVMELSRLFKQAHEKTSELLEELGLKKKRNRKN